MNPNQVSSADTSSTYFDRFSFEASSTSAADGASASVRSLRMNDCVFFKSEVSALDTGKRVQIQMAADRVRVDQGRHSSFGLQGEVSE